MWPAGLHDHQAVHYLWAADVPARLAISSKLP
jgi:hypothetical protein